VNYIVQAISVPLQILHLISMPLCIVYYLPVDIDETAQAQGSIVELLELFISNFLRTCAGAAGSTAFLSELRTSPTLAGRC
jgi:hypothetical protein